MRLPSLSHVAAFIVLAALTPGSPAWGDQILETYDSSLTSYLPSSKSNIQDIRPLYEQRGVHHDGTLRAGSTHPMALAGNPSGDGWNRNQTFSGVRLDTGTFIVNDVDLSFPAEVPWIIARSYNARQKTSGGSYYASAGYQGRNWFADSAQKLVFHDPAGQTSDAIYLLYRADAYIEFKRAEDGEEQPSTDTFKAVNGAAGAILLHTFDGIDLATYYDQRGYRFDFFWFGDADIDDEIEGNLWRIIDPTVSADPYDTGDRLESGDGNIAYVGDIGDPGTAQTSGFHANGAIKTAYDSAGRRFTYSVPGSLLTQVLVEQYDSGWVEVGKVEYTYYVAADSHGEDDDLETVTITTPLTDSGVSLVRKKYYRYYEGSYHATNNPGYHHQLQYIIDFEGYRAFDWDQDSTLDDDPLTASENDLKPYASAYFEYDTERRIVSAWFNGACGCSGGTSGTHEFEYESNGSYSDGTGYDTTWKSRTIVKLPEVTYETASGAIKSYLTQYFDELGQPLHRVRTDDDPDNTSPAPDVWATKVTRNSDGQVTDISSPANVTGYTHSTASFTTSTTAGLVNTFTRVASGDLAGFPEDAKHRTGTSGSAYLDGTVEYTSASLTVGDVSVVRPFVDARWTYAEETTTEAGGGTGPSGAEETTFAYTFYTGAAALMPKQITTTNPAVSTASNGSGSAASSNRYLRQDGSTAFSEAADGIFTYTLFEDGRLTKRIDDAQTSHASDFASGDDPNGTWGITETADGVRRITTYTYDPQGRSDTVTQPDGRIMKRYYSKLADERMVTLGYADYESTPKFYGPVSYTVANHAGKVETQATVALEDSTTALTGHIDESDSDPITAMDLASVARLATSIYDEPGTTLEESRQYFDIPASGAGTEGTHYDATTFAYDDQGRRYRTKAPHGTITRTDFDTLGRTVRQWIGTNDNDFDGGESSGTDNMVKTSESVYDSGSDKGNSFLTKRTLFVEDGATGQRVTEFEHDVRGRVLLQENPADPLFVLSKYDNLGRTVAVGTYTGDGSGDVTASDDPTTRTTDRLALSQTFYDAMGRVWKSQRHKIDDADGSDDDHIQALTWYDAVGRVIKVKGTELTKTAYDRLGRTTHQFILASDNDSAYADADDVAGDIVLVESQTVYESTDSDDVLMTASISRFHDDYGGSETTGALDTNADADDLKYTAANIEGRIQITASWYDRFGRITDSVSYGTSGGTDFDRDGLSVPARSDTALLTEWEYNTDGSLKSLTDPRALVTRHEYDDAGRRTAVISNYVDGTPSGDTDHYVRYEFEDGLQTKMWVDLDGDDVEDADDQVTLYIFGVTEGTGAGDSTITASHLLRAIVYPDSTNTGTTSADIDTDDSDVVSFAYNAQGHEIERKDQDGNVIETEFDTAGRTTAKKVTTLATGFDGAVRRIATAYDDLGRVATVTQYDAATAGTVVNEVKNTFNDWSLLSKFEQDHDSAVGGGGTLLYDIDYTYAKATSGRNAIRRTALDLPDGTDVSYTYSSSGSLHDDEASRVTKVSVTIGSNVTVAEYRYNGVSGLVGIDYPEADVFMQHYGTTSGSYPGLDRFNRVTSSVWTKDLATDRDFYDVDVAYDRNSNIVELDESVHAGFDVDFTIDDQDRLTDAQEGTLSGGSITNEKRQQSWTALSQTGNWERAKLDLNGDNDYLDADEYDDSRTHNVANELTARNTDSTGADEHTLTLDKLGNITGDDDAFEFVFDPFGRLRKVKSTNTGDLVAEYTYSGLGHRIGWHYDVDADGTVEDTSDDPWYRFVYDERWRIVATFRGSDSDPKEQFVYHAAGNDGLGGSSYIDDVILRDRDANTAWSAASDGTLEERLYYCQNWRHDVVALIDDAGGQVEQVRYTAYGIPDGLPAGDLDSDGGVDNADVTAFDALPGYDVLADLDLDGDNDSADRTAITAARGTTLGFGVSSLAGNRKAYAGYEFDNALQDAYRLYHVRHRVLNSDLGRWISRDPAGYVDGMSLYGYVSTKPVKASDPFGLFAYVPPLGGVQSLCCAASLARGEVEDHEYGWVVCCNGMLVPCVRFPPPAASDDGLRDCGAVTPANRRAGCERADELITQCARERHEQCHINNGDAQCSVPDCPWVIRACFPHTMAEIDRWDAECTCYAEEFACLCPLIEECADDDPVVEAECELRIHTHVRLAAEYANTEYACVPALPTRCEATSVGSAVP